MDKSDTSYLVRLPDGTELGPASLDDLRAWAAAGVIERTTAVQVVGTETRIPAATVLGLFSSSASSPEVNLGAPERSPQPGEPVLPPSTSNPTLNRSQSPAYDFFKVVGVNDEIYQADELPDLARMGLILPKTELLLGDDVRVQASQVSVDGLEFPDRLDDAQVRHLCHLATMYKETAIAIHPEVPSSVATCFSVLKERAQFAEVFGWQFFMVGVPFTLWALWRYTFFGWITVAVVVFAGGKAVRQVFPYLIRALEDRAIAIQERAATVEARARQRERHARERKKYQLRDLAQLTLERLALSEASRIMGGIQVGCIEAVNTFRHEFANAHGGGKLMPTAWLRSCISDDLKLIACTWENGVATIESVDSNAETLLIQYSGLKRVSMWFCDYEHALFSDDTDAIQNLKARLLPRNEKLKGIAALNEIMDPGGLRETLGLARGPWQRKPTVAMWLDFKPGMKWAEVISFAEGAVHLSSSTSRNPSLRISLSDLESIRTDYKILVRAALDGVVDARMPEVVSRFKELLFQRIDEVCAQATPRSAEDSANLKVLAEKVARTDATIRAHFAKLMTDPEFGSYFEGEVASIRAERELEALEKKLAEDAKLRERELKALEKKHAEDAKLKKRELEALEKKLAEDAKLELKRLEAEINFRKLHLHRENERQDETLKALQQQADAAERAVQAQRDAAYAAEVAAHNQRQAAREAAKEQSRATKDAAETVAREIAIQAWIDRLNRKG